VVSAADPLRSLISVFLSGAATFLSSSSSFILTRAEWTPFQTHCYSENLVAPGIEPETSGLTCLDKGVPNGEQLAGSSFPIIAGYSDTLRGYCALFNLSVKHHLLNTAPSKMRMDVITGARAPVGGGGVMTRIIIRSLGLLESVSLRSLSTYGAVTSLATDFPDGDKLV
jgi:hypothetical protein